MSGFRFRLYLQNGEDVGTFTTAVPDWKLGDVFLTGDGHRFRITNIVWNDGWETDDFHGAFVVTPVELAEPV